MKDIIKIGDKVTLLSEEQLYKLHPNFKENEYFDYVDEMSSYLGKTFTVRRIDGYSSNGSYYYFEEDDDSFRWYYKYIKDISLLSMEPFYVRGMGIWQAVDIYEKTIEGILFDTKEDCENWINSKLGIK